MLIDPALDIVATTYFDITNNPYSSSSQSCYSYELLDSGTNSPLTLPLPGYMSYTSPTLRVVATTKDMLGIPSFPHNIRIKAKSKVLLSAS